MAQVDFAERQLTLKLVYYGPPLSGKTSNLRALHGMVDQLNRGRLMTLDTRDDRTLFFDLLPIFFRTSGFSFRIKVYTVPGQPVHEATRKVVLQGVDGVVFVADSQEERMDANIESLYNLEENLAAQGYDLTKLPYVLQLNKRDLPNVVPMEDLAQELRRKDEPVFEAVAATGQGVFDTLKGVAKQVLTELRKS